MSKKYFCEACGTNHLLNSKIGMKHRGINVVEKKRKTFKVALPDGTEYKTTSVYDYKFATITHASRCTRLETQDSDDPKDWYNEYTDYHWFAELYVDKARADDRASIYNKHLKPEHIKAKAEVIESYVITL